MSTRIYKRLGDCIRLVDVRNRDLKVEKLLGLSVEKCFIPSVANIIGTDMSTYKIIEYGQFVYIADTSRRGDKIAIALYNEEKKAMVSQAYTVFEIADKEQLCPDYLMMWFRRPEFDRYARFKSHGSAREIFDWETMCDITLPIPSIEEQRRVVSEYEALTQRVKINNQLIAKLEDTAQTIYRKMFVDGIDEKHLPEGWRMGTIGDIAEITSGKTCSQKSHMQNDIYIYPVAGASGIIGFSNLYNQDCSFLTIGRVGTLGKVNRYKGKIYTADNVLIIKSNWQEYSFQILQSINYEDIIKGGVQNLIIQMDLKEYHVIIPAEKKVEMFEDCSSSIYSLIERKRTENKKTTELQSLLLAKMGK